jgi:hypothetical protein
MLLRDILGYDDPANRAQLLVEHEGRASVALAPFSCVGSGTLPPFRNASIQDHSNGRVPRKRSLQTLVELLAIAGDDNDLSHHLRLFVMPLRRGRALVNAPQAARRRGLLQETRERCPRLASTGRACSGANFEALVAIDTQGEPAQR